MSFVPVSLDYAQQRPDKEEGFKLRPHQLWSAFCRHWFLALTLGVLAAIPAAYLAWKYTPTPYRAKAEVFVQSSRPRVNFTLEEDQIQARTFKARQMKLVLDRTTLNMTLDDEDVSKLPLIRELGTEGDAMDWLAENLKVQNTGEEYFTISLEGENPFALKTIIDKVTRVYYELTSKESGLATSERYNHIVSELERLNKSIEAKQGRIEELSEIANAGTSEQLNIWIEHQRDLIGAHQVNLTNIETRLLEIDALLESFDGALEDEKLKAIWEKEVERSIKADQRYKAYDNLIEGYEGNIATWIELFNSADMKQIHDLKKKIAEAKKNQQEEYEKLKVEYRENGLKALERDQDINVAALEHEREVLLVKQKKVIEKITELTNEETKTVGEGIKLDNIRETLEEEKKMAASLRAEKEKIDVEKKAGNRIEIDDPPAELPRKRETKKRNMLTAGSGLGSFGLVVALFVLLELRHMRVNSLKVLEEEFHFPILGTVPHLPVRVLQSADNSGKTARHRRSFTESIDSARTVLLNQQKKHPLKVIMVTSSIGGEGKSTLSSHLAISFARAGRKTLLIDGDLRRPRVHEVFQIADFPGLCEALRDETPVEKCIHSSGVTRLDLLPAGEVDSYTLQMLAENRVEEVLNTLRKAYDVVIFDSSPVLPVADSLLLMQVVDGVVMSIRKDHSRISKVVSALKKIELVQGRIIGGIVIGIDEAEYGYHASYYNRELEPVAG